MLVNIYLLKTHFDINCTRTVIHQYVNHFQFKVVGISHFSAKGGRASWNKYVTCQALSKWMKMDCWRMWEWNLMTSNSGLTLWEDWLFFFFFRKRQGPFTKFTSAVRRCQTTGKEDNSYNLLNTFCVSDTVGCPLPTNFCLSLITTHFTNEKNEG